jgi:hypothetical protein
MQHTSTYVSIRQHTSIPQNKSHTSSIQHTPAYVSIRQHTSAYVDTSAKVSHTLTPPHTFSYLLPSLQRLYHQLMLVLEARIPVDLGIVEAVGEATLPHLCHKALFACSLVGVRLLLSLKRYWYRCTSSGLVGVALVAV